MVKISSTDGGETEVSLIDHSGANLDAPRSRSTHSRRSLPTQSNTITRYILSNHKPSPTTSPLSRRQGDSADTQTPPTRGSGDGTEDSPSIISSAQTGTTTTTTSSCDNSQSDASLSEKNSTASDVEHTAAGQPSISTAATDPVVVVYGNNSDSDNNKDNNNRITAKLATVKRSRLGSDSQPTARKGNGAKIRHKRVWEEIEAQDGTQSLRKKRCVSSAKQSGPGRPPRGRPRSKSCSSSSSLVIAVQTVDPKANVSRANSIAALINPLPSSSKAETTAPPRLAGTWIDCRQGTLKFKHQLATKAHEVIVDITTPRATPHSTTSLSFEDRGLCDTCDDRVSLPKICSTCAPISCEEEEDNRLFSSPTAAVTSVAPLPAADSRDGQELEMLHALNKEYFSAVCGEGESISRESTPEREFVSRELVGKAPYGTTTSEATGTTVPPESSDKIKSNAIQLCGPVTLLGCFEFFSREQLERKLHARNIAVRCMYVGPRRRTRFVIMGSRMLESQDHDDHAKAVKMGIKVVKESELLEWLGEEDGALKCAYEPKYRNLSNTNERITSPSPSTERCPLSESAPTPDWCSKYRPVSLHEVVGHKQQIMQLYNFLLLTKTAKRSGEKESTKLSHSNRRSAVLMGPQDCGIKLTAQLCAYGAGYDVCVKAGDEATQYLQMKNKAGKLSERTRNLFLNGAMKNVRPRAVILSGIEPASLTYLKEMNGQCSDMVIAVVEEELKLENRPQTIKFTAPSTNAAVYRLEGICKFAGLNIGSDSLLKIASTLGNNIPRCLRELREMYLTQRDWTLSEVGEWLRHSDEGKDGSMASDYWFSSDWFGYITKSETSLEDRLRLSTLNAEDANPFAFCGDAQENYLTAFSCEHDNESPSTAKGGGGGGEVWPWFSSMADSVTKLSFGFEPISRVAQSADNFALVDQFRSAYGTSAQCVGKEAPVYLREPEMQTAEAEIITNLTMAATHLLTRRKFCGDSRDDTPAPTE